MLIIGLTGGIGSGKSSVSQQFESLDIAVIDADIIARKLVAPGQPALEEIAQQFGPQFILPNGELDRAQLRQHIFNSNQNDNRLKLESILHPRARIEVQQQISTLTSALPHPAYIILSVPLLIESGWVELVNRVLVLDSSRETRIQRIQKRDQLSIEDINHIMDSQTADQTRLDAADDVIDNNGNLDALIQQVNTLHQKYLALAHSA